MHKCNLEIECENPKIVIESLKPEINETEKFKIKIKENDKKIFLEVYANTLSNLMAGINSYLKLIKLISEGDDKNV
ncbi:MAG: KEOPS complex subunit Pcc1 [Candidatus Aenigmatarchaeota archaeon]|nr:hypothetical protein [Candidatus Aenigmarchaeota archaeon]